MELCASTVWTSLMRVCPVSRSIAPCRFSRSRPDVTSIAQRWPRGSHRPAGLAWWVGWTASTETIVSSASSELRKSSCASMNFCWVSASILLGTGSGFFQSKPMRFISLISPDLPYSMPNRLRMNCPTSTVDAGRTSIAQARSSSIWRGDNAPVPPLRSNRTSSSTPPSSNALSQARMVESSTKRTLATSSNFIPRSRRRMAFARRAMRCSSSPSLAIFTRSARSGGRRKLRSVFTKRLESIPLIRSNDFSDVRGFPLYPEADVLPAYTEIKTPLVICADDFLAIAHYSVVSRDYGGVDAARFASMGLVNIEPVITAPPPSSLVVNDPAVRLNELIATLAQLYRLPLDAAATRAVLADLGRTGEGEES